jgi:DNA replication protein DnaC
MQHLERMTFDTFLPEGHGLNEWQQRSLQLAFERAFAFAQKPQGWLLLRGTYGCGKTHLAAAIANECIARGQPVLFINVPDLLDHLRATFGPSSEVSFDQRFEEIRDAPVLVLDDLGTQNTTPWAQEKLYQIFNHRYNAQLPTVVTTNQDLEDIDSRLRSRLLHVAFVEQVKIMAPDFRGMGGDQAKAELSNLQLYKDQTFESFRLREGEIESTEVENLRYARTLAQSYAAELCGSKPTVINPNTEIPNWRRSSPDLPRPNWLVFTGDYGCGKTHLAAAIANYLEEYRRPVLFIVVPDLLDHLRAAFGPQSSVSYDKRFEEIRTASFLVLDDLGTESATPWAKEKLYQLINYRYVARLSTVITTSWAIEELDPKIATRILDSTRCTVFAILAPSYRGGKHTAPRRKASVSRRGR